MKERGEHVLLTVLIGSQAHGLAAPESDADYRAVFAIPTEELFRVGFKAPGVRMTKGAGDQTAWEVGTFLRLARDGDPLALETLVAPIVSADDWGHRLRKLFPALWSPRHAHAAFVAYALNQRKKFLDKKDGRPGKYAAAYLRVLYNLCELLETGTFTVCIAETAAGPDVARAKAGTLRTGDVIELGERWTDEAATRLTRCRHESDPQAVDAFAIAVRRAFLRDSGA